MAQTLLNINQYGATYGGASNAYQFYLVVTLNSQSTANNTSNITVTHSANGRNGWGYSGFSTPTSTITVGGTQRVSSTVSGIPTNGASVTLSTWTGNVTHNNDGTLSLAVSATYNPNTTGYSYVPRTNTLSGTITLPTIPRASDVTVSNYTISNTTGSISATITSRANFYHRWRWKVGSGSWSGWNNKGLIATTSSTVTVSNSNLLSRMPSDKSATFTIEVATYSDSSYSTHVGTKSASSTLTVTIKPSVSLGNIAINTSPISGYAVAGYSTVKATWSATPGSGASNGTTYFSISTGSVTASSSTASSGTVTSTTIPGSASNYTLTITAYTVDSRGLRSDNVSKSITVYGYQPPTATLSAYRVADSTSTTEDGAGVYVYVTFSGAVRSTVNSQNSIQSTKCTYSGSIRGTASNGQHIALADSQSATFTLTVRDKVTSSTAIVSVAPALYPLDLYDNGQGAVGVGFGTTAESGKVKSALPIRSESYGSFGGFVFADGGQVIAGTSTLSSRDTYVICRSIAGDIYFSCGNTATAIKGIWAKNNAGVYTRVLTIDQNNKVTFPTDINISGVIYDDGGHVVSGTLTRNAKAYVEVRSLAGKIYLESGESATAPKSLNVMNNAGTYKAIIGVDQNNVATFYGRVPRSIIWAKASQNTSITAGSTYRPTLVQVKQVGSDFSISSGDVVCLRAGTVRVTAKVGAWYATKNEGGMTCWIYQDGNLNNNTQNTVSWFSNGVMVLDALIDVTANSHLNVRVRNDSAGALSIQSASSFIVEYVN